MRLGHGGTLQRHVQASETLAQHAGQEVTQGLGLGLSLGLSRASVAPAGFLCHPWFLLTRGHPLSSPHAYPLIVLEAGSLRSRFQQDHAPSKDSQGESVLCLFQLLVAPSVPVLWLHHCSLCLCVPTASPLLPGSLPCMSPMRTPVI